MLCRVLMVIPETSVNVVSVELMERRYVVSSSLKTKFISHPNCC